MKTWKLLLLALVPGLWGWLCNWLTAVSLNGPASCWRGWGSTPASRCFPWPAGW